MNIQENENMYELCKYSLYEKLMNDYIGLIIDLIESANKMRILPLKIMLSIGFIKNYIDSNRLIILQNGIEYLLNNKETILNFDITKLDDLDVDTDDNVSIKSCINNYKAHNNQSFNMDDDQNEILNLIIDIKNNSKKLSSIEVNIIKKYIELIITTLEQMEKLFN